MRLKTSHPSFKLLPAVGAVALLSALAACGGGPIDNSGVVGTASKNPLRVETTRWQPTESQTETLPPRPWSAAWLRVKAAET